jgi:hypothetical protein
LCIEIKKMKFTICARSLIMGVADVPISRYIFMFDGYIYMIN